MGFKPIYYSTPDFEVFLFYICYFSYNCTKLYRPVYQFKMRATLQVKSKAFLLVQLASSAVVWFSISPIRQVYCLWVFRCMCLTLCAL